MRPLNADLMRWLQLLALTLYTQQEDGVCKTRCAGGKSCPNSTDGSVHRRFTVQVNPLMPVPGKSLIVAGDV